LINRLYPGGLLKVQTHPAYTIPAVNTPVPGSDVLLIVSSNSAHVKVFNPGHELEFLLIDIIVQSKVIGVIGIPLAGGNRLLIPLVEFQTIILTA
jgi:hypothetical protein